MSSISSMSGSATAANAFRANSTNQTSQAQNGRRTADDVLASLREMMPGWNISTSTADWGEGFRNIQIDRDILERMANDPAEMDRVTSMIREFESAVPELEQWQEQNPGQSLILSLMLDENGNTSATATIRTLLGAETSTTFDPLEPSWLENLMAQLSAPPQGHDWTV
ncbi:MAG: DUF6033 family protein [Oscillospiraceae bacterium]|nr:DUF6033 family protein [Oscillospiraceae bacterium]